MSKKCQYPYCRNEAYTNPNTGYTRKYCNRCKSRVFKENNPYSYYYNCLKQSAKKRDIEFSLTKAEFIELWKKHPEKWEEKVKGVHGMSGKTWSVDREDPDEGYHADNVQILSLRRNVIKYVRRGQFYLEVYWSDQNYDFKFNEEVPF